MSTEQQPAFPPPAERFAQQPTPIVRRHWDGNGWTQPTPTVEPGTPLAHPADERLGRTAS
jgi:hypothetical protein